MQNLQSNWIFLFLFLSLISCASFKADKKYTLKKDIKYSNEDKRQVGDLYLSSEKSQPIVFLVHGGGWKGRSKSDMDNIAESLATHGFNVFNINYRLSPKYRHPAPIEDLELAINFIKNNKKYSIDLKQIGLWGYSSGGHTVSSYAVMKNNTNIKAVVSGGAPYDFTWYPKSPYIKSYLGKYRDELLNEYFSASPSFKVKKNLPPFFLYHAETDTLVEYAQTTSFAAKLKQHNIPVETYTVPFWGHALAFVFSTESVKRGVQFLKKELHR